MNKVYLILMLFCVSCSGYRFKGRSNPFEQYGIKKIYIPMFYNHSNLANISNPFTKSITWSLSGYDGLKLTRDKSSADAILVGILTTEDKIRNSKTPTSKRAVKNIVQDDIGQRNDFFLPASGEMRVTLRLFVIKKPSEAELKILKSKLGESQVRSDKVIFNESISVTATYSKVMSQGIAGQTNYTRTRGIERQTIEKLADDAAINFKEMILYAF